MNLQPTLALLGHIAPALVLGTAMGQEGALMDRGEKAPEMVAGELRVRRRDPAETPNAARRELDPGRGW
jgi:hypothetical protein